MFESDQKSWRVRNFGGAVRGKTPALRLSYACRTPVEACQSLSCLTEPDGSGRTLYISKKFEIFICRFTKKLFASKRWIIETEDTSMISEAEVNFYFCKAFRKY